MPGAEKKKKKKSKTKKKNYYLVKIPKYLSREWFENDEKFPKGSKLAEFGRDEGGKMRLTVDTKGIDGVKANIPSNYTLNPIKKKKRFTLKWGEKKEAEEEMQWVFQDDTEFPAGSTVDAVTTEGDTTVYKRATVLSTNGDRTHNLHFEDGRIANNVPGKKICPVDVPQKADKCMRKGKVNSSFLAHPIRTAEDFKKFNLHRSKTTVVRKRTRVRRRTESNIYTMDDESRRKKVKILLNKRNERKKKISVLAEKKPRAVRKTEQVYQDLICTAFNDKDHLGKKELEARTKEPFNFLKPVLAQLCDYNQSGPNRMTYSLKEDYR